jgi:hypothetical protein
MDTKTADADDARLLEKERRRPRMQTDEHSYLRDGVMKTDTTSTGGGQLSRKVVVGSNSLIKKSPLPGFFPDFFWTKL